MGCVLENRATDPSLGELEFGQWPRLSQHVRFAMVKCSAKGPLSGFVPTMQGVLPGNVEGFDVIIPHLRVGRT